MCVCACSTGYLVSKGFGGEEWVRLSGLWDEGVDVEIRGRLQGVTSHVLSIQNRGQTTRSKAVEGASIPPSNTTTGGRGWSSPIRGKLMLLFRSTLDRRCVRMPRKRHEKASLIDA